MSGGARIAQLSLASGVYARVLREGGLASGDPARSLTDGEAAALIGGR
jgi:MOSC domain-containing protein YiiM